ncbi:MAG: CBS domain-containing protein, partial [Actinophytocola sp.]|nr:CBS domain-containing protein [Actinophytocola sp.]
VFVTHDIREAMALGSKIALLEVGGLLAQYDTPERLLTAPSNEFVSEFIGPGKEVRRLDLARVSDSALDPVTTVRAADASAAERPAPDGSRTIVVDESGRPQRWLHETGAAGIPVVRENDTLYQALDALLDKRHDVAVVVDDDGVVVGTLPWSTVLHGLPARHGSETAQRSS